MKKTILPLILSTIISGNPVIAKNNPYQFFTPNIFENNSFELNIFKPLDGKICDSDPNSIKEKLFRGTNLAKIEKGIYSHFPALRSFGKYDSIRDILLYEDKNSQKTLAIHFVGGMIGYVIDGRLEPSSEVETKFCINNRL